jgi:hypothetical protein
MPAGTPRSREQGVVLVTVLMASMLLIALATGLVAVTTIETLVSANYRSASEGLFAAEAGVDLVIADLSSVADWSTVLAGGSAASCPVVRRPDEPDWRLRLCGRLDDLLGGGRLDSQFTIAVWVADDAADGDGQPLSDSNNVLVVRGEAFGPMGVSRAVEAVVERAAAGIRVVSWRAIL